MRSFVNCGHSVELYAYADLDVPPGVTLCDASRVLPLTDVFCRAYGRTSVSVSAFSNLFRYKMLFEKGGIWADTDIFCQKSLTDLPDACV